MKMKQTILALSACSIAILPAQTAAPEKPATKKAEMAAEPTADTPVEKQAFKMFAMLETALPEILGGIKDEASLEVASTKIDHLLKKVKMEEAALLKLDVPDNDARVKLSEKLAIKEKNITAKMMPIIMGMQKLDPAILMKIGPMMQKFDVAMAESDTLVNKYFKTDEEQAAGEGE